MKTISSRDPAASNTLRAMKFTLLATSLALLAVGCGSSNSSAPTAAQSGPTMSFFVSSAKSTTGNLAGLAGADATCQRLAQNVGLGAKTWRAYLSVEHDAANNNNATDARSRIGSGPWFNAKGVMVAANLTDLHARKGDATVFLDETGEI